MCDLLYQNLVLSAQREHLHLEIHHLEIYHFEIHHFVNHHFESHHFESHYLKYIILQTITLKVITSQVITWKSSSLSSKFVRWVFFLFIVFTDNTSIAHLASQRAVKLVVFCVNFNTLESLERRFPTRLWFDDRILDLESPYFWYILDHHSKHMLSILV